MLCGSPLHYLRGRAVFMTRADNTLADLDVLGGKPVIEGTRLAVDFVLGVVAEGWSPKAGRSWRTA